MSEQENVRLVRQAYENFKRGDIQGVLNLCAEEIDWRLPQIEQAPFSGPRRGRDQVAQFFQLVGESQEPLEFEPREFIAQGDQVVALGHYVWRVKATGRSFEGDWAHAWTLRGGKAVSFHEYTDTAACAAAYRALAAAS